MRQMVFGFPEQLLRAWTIGMQCHFNFKRKAGFDNVVIAGMGGSAIGGDVVRTVLGEETTLPVLVWRDYQLPPGVNRKTLVFVSSCSGNTEEALSAYEETKRCSGQVVVITSGGKLAAMAQGDRIPLVLVPGGMPPRASIGFMSVPMLAVLYHLGLCRSYEADVHEASRLIERRRQYWWREAKRSARFLFNRWPIIYSLSRLLDVAAYRWQCQFNENAKVLAHWGCLPEASHNEIMGFGSAATPAPVLFGLVDRSTHPRTILRWRQMLKLIRGAYTRARLVRSEGRLPLARLLGIIVVGDLISVALAEQRGVDPIAILKIEQLKHDLGRKKG